uniref:Peptidase S1 domain-containing protein n=1 Tax=Steinernema glaseri TaxID=37863 RepID=A0A1I8ATG6_9BILA
MSVNLSALNRTYEIRRTFCELFHFTIVGCQGPATLTILYIAQNLIYTRKIAMELSSLAAILRILGLIVGQPAISPNKTMFNVSHDERDWNVSKSQNYSATLVMGKPVDSIERWASQVRIEYETTDGTNGLCGGVLITEIHILTAGHCASNMVTEKSYAFMGQIDLEGDKSEQQSLEISNKIVHPEYDPKSLKADIAVLEVQSGFILSSGVKTAQLPFEDAKVWFNSVITIGWGASDPNYPEKSSKQLREVEMPVIPLEQCKRSWNRLKPDICVDDTVICAGAKGKGTGRGDSGGPLFALNNETDVLVGLTTFGGNSESEMYDQNEYPGVYTRVSAYCDFIKEATNNMTSCGKGRTENSHLYALSQMFVIVFILLITCTVMVCCCKRQ